MMFKKTLSFLAIVLSSFAHAQDTAITNPLKQQLLTTNDDTAKVWIYRKLFMAYRDADSAAAMDAVTKGIALSQKAGFKKGESLLWLDKGNFLNINGENIEAEIDINKALAIRKATNDLAGQGYCLRSLGNLQFDKNNYTEALAYYLDAVPLFEKGNDLKGLCGDYIWIGNVFNQGLRQFDKAVEYFHKSLDIAQQLNDTALIGYNYNNLGQAFYNDHKLDQSLTYYQKSKLLKEALKDDYGIGSAYGNISNVYFDQKKYALALAYNDSSLAIRERVNDKKGIATCYLNGANIQLQINNLEVAYAWYQKAIALGTEIDFHEPIIESYSGLSSYYEKKGDAPLALEFYKKYKSASDSIYNADVAEQLHSLQIKFETEKQANRLQEQAFQLSQKNYIIISSLVLLVLVSLLGYSYYRRYRLRQEKKLQTEIMKQQDLSTRAVLKAEEDERERIARELHDGVGQMMSAAKMNLSSFETDLHLQTEKQKIAYGRIVDLVDESCREVRSVSHQMMPNALLKKGLASAISEFVDKIDNRILKVDLYSEGLNERIDSAVETVLYRVVQECVNNVIKHSGANHLDISLIKDSDGISVTIEDNGKGFDTSNPEKFEGIGLKNIRTRIQYLKGTVDFDSTPGNGTLVAIHVPVEIG